jgi:hypothetical protein
MAAMETTVQLVVLVRVVRSFLKEQTAILALQISPEVVVPED